MTIHILLATVLVVLSGCKARSQSQLFEGSPVEPEWADAQQYKSACKDVNVPIPLAANDKSFWQTSRTVDHNFSHFGPGDEANLLLRHQSPQGGGCYLLTTETEMKVKDAAICWSAEGSVCFWETEHNGAQEKQIVADLDAAIPTAQLGNNCLQCHRGDNPLVGHDFNGDPAFQDFPIVELKNPLVPKAWLESFPVGPSLSKGSESYQCAEGCHSIPKLEGEPQVRLAYCSMASRMMEAGMMLGQELGVAEGSPARSVELASIEDRCQQWISFQKVCFPWNFQPNGASSSEVLGYCAELLPPWPFNEANQTKK